VVDKETITEKLEDKAIMKVTFSMTGEFDWAHTLPLNPKNVAYRDIAKQLIHEKLLKDGADAFDLRFTQRVRVLPKGEEE